MSNPEYLIIPFEVLSDERLTLRQIRVLMAIFSWRKKNTGLARVSRELLSERTGYPLSRISTITSELVDLGWIENVGNGGKSQWSEYRVKDVSNSQENGYQNGNGNQIGNGYQNGNETVTNSVTQTVTDSVRGIDTEVNNRSNNSNKKTKAKKAGLDFSKAPFGISHESIQNWIEHRDILKKPMTQRAFDLSLSNFTSVANELQCGIDWLIDYTIDAGWLSVKADWVRNREACQAGQSRQQAYNAPLTGDDLLEARL